MLRETPGVLDCSVSDEGIAVVVHPEVDPRMLEIRVQAALAELGDRRPLLVVGGMSTAGGAYPPAGAAPRHTDRPGMRRPGLPRGRSSMPVLGFVVLVVAAITLVPLAGRTSSSRVGRLAGGPTPAAAPTSGVSAPSAGGVVNAAGARRTFGPLPVVDEVVAAALAPASRRSGPAAGGVRAAGRSDVVAVASPSTAPAVVPAQAASPTAASAAIAGPSTAGPGRSAAAGEEGDKVKLPREKRSKHDGVAAASFGDDPDRSTSAKGKGKTGNGGGKPHKAKVGKPDNSGKAHKAHKADRADKADKADKGKGRGTR